MQGDSVLGEEGLVGQGCRGGGRSNNTAAFGGCHAPCPTTKAPLAHTDNCIADFPALCGEEPTTPRMGVFILVDNTT